MFVKFLYVNNVWGFSLFIEKDISDKVVQELVTDLFSP